MIHINFLAVFTSAVASMIIGAIWYGPLLGKEFMQAMGMDKWTPEHKAKMQKSMMMSYALQFVSSIFMFDVLAWLMAGLGQMSVRGGLLVATLLWIGFVVPLKFGEAIWGGKMILFWISISNMLIALFAAAVIIGAWG